MLLSIYSRSHILAVLPLSFIDPSSLINQLAVSTPLAIKPLSNVVVAIAVNKPPITVINIINELTLVDNVIDLFTNSGDLAV